MRLRQQEWPCRSRLDETSSLMRYDSRSRANEMMRDQARLADINRGVFDLRDADFFNPHAFAFDRVDSVQTGAADD